MRASIFVGRVGGLAVALGIGSSVVIGGAGVAWADPGDSTTSVDGADSASEATSAAGQPSARQRGLRSSRAVEKPAGTAEARADRSVQVEAPHVAARGRGARGPAVIPRDVSTPRNQNSTAAETVVPTSSAPPQDLPDQPVAVPTAAESLATVAMPPATASSPATPVLMAPVTELAETTAVPPVMVATPEPSAAAPGVVESVLAPISDNGPVAPVEAAVSWVMLAAARRELGTPAGAQSIPVAAVPTGPLLDTDAVPNQHVTRSAIPAPAAAEGAVQIVDPVASATATNPIAAFFEQIQAFVTQIVTAITQVINQVVSAIINIFSPAPANKVPVAAAPPTVGTPDAATGVVTGTVTATDPDGNTVTYSAPATTAKGTVVIDAVTGEFVYTPTAAARHAAASLTGTDAQEADTFTVTATDERGGKGTISVAVVISPVNAAPVAGTASVGDPDTSTGVVTGSVSATDADGDTLTFSGSGNTAKGAVVVNADGAFFYTPTQIARHAAARDGAEAADLADSFTISIAHGHGGSATAAVNLVISPSNAAPVAEVVSISAPDTSTGAVAGVMVVSDADGDTITYSVPVATARGEITFDPDGAFTYTPTTAARHEAARDAATDVDTTDTFTVTFTDGHGGSVVVPVVVAIAPVNSAPQVVSLDVGEPDGATGVVAGSIIGADADGDSLSYSSDAPSGRGGVVVFIADGSFSYTPTAEARRAAFIQEVGAESDFFMVTVTDGYGGSVDMPVTVPVGPAVTYYLTNDVKRDPETGQIALRTIFSEETQQPGTGAPGYLNWLIATPNRGALNAFPADVASWEDLFLVGTSPVSNPYNSFQSVPPGSVLRNPVNGAVAIRTIFDDGEPAFADRTWLIATSSQGALQVSSASVTGWDILLVPGNSPTILGYQAGDPEPSGVIRGQINAADSDGDALTFSAPAATAKGYVFIDAQSGAFTYAPTGSVRQAAAQAASDSDARLDTFIVTVSDGYLAAQTEVTVEIDPAPPLRPGDIRIAPPGVTSTSSGVPQSNSDQGMWRAMYSPNVAVGRDWIAVIPDNGGTWLTSADVGGWIDVAPPTGTETTSGGPYSPGDIKVPPPGLTGGEYKLFAVKSGPPLSSILDWMVCSTVNACGGTSDDGFYLSPLPIDQWVDLRNPLDL